MKKIFALLLIAASLFSFSCSAQGGKQGMAMMRQRLKDSLKLSDVQADSVISIRQEYQPQIREIMKDPSLSKDQKKEKVKPLKKQMISKLKTFLSEEQMGKLEQMEQEMRQGKKQNDGS
jgi:hypothetical protein